MMFAMPHEDRIELLRKLGLSTLQAKVYLALVDLENATASEVSKLSDIARPETYRIINELLERGLVSKIISSPTKFQPIPLKEGASILFESRTIEFYELKTIMQQLIERRFKQKGKVQKERYTFRKLPENSPWFRNNALRFAKYKTFDLLTTSKRFGSRIVFDEEPFRKGARKGIKIRIILDEPKSGYPLSKIIESMNEEENIEIMCLNSVSPVVLIIMDQKEVNLALSPSNRVGPPYLASNHPSFVLMAQHYFEAQWEKAAKMI